MPETIVPLTFDTLDPFTRAYIIAALWSTNDESDPSGGEPIDNRFDGHDVHPDALAEMSADCKLFREENAADLALAYERYGSCGDGSTPEERAGHDFWLTRCGHGVGFWDRPELDADGVGQRLTDACEKFGEAHVWVDEEAGKVHSGW
jgi:hypothetical protein